MIRDTIAQIEEKLRAAGNLSEERRRELLGLLNALNEEVTNLSETQREQAESIRRFTELSAHEATRSEKDEKLLDHAVEGLSSSVRGFEASHPRLVETVNAICFMLSNIGI